MVMIFNDVIERSYVTGLRHYYQLFLWLIGVYRLCSVQLVGLAYR